jgi:hypothetical protein
LLVHRRGSFGASEALANRVLAVGVRRQRQTAMLSEREITVLGLLPSMLSLEETALDLTCARWWRSREPTAGDDGQPGRPCGGPVE